MRSLAPHRGSIRSSISCRGSAPKLLRLVPHEWVTKGSKLKTQLAAESKSVTQLFDINCSVDDLATSEINCMCTDREESVDYLHLLPVLTVLLVAK